jgi:Zn finger protein HypA/HybF involved in hydrogenase expression
VVSIEIKCNYCGCKYENELFVMAVCPDCGSEHKTKKQIEKESKRS